MTATRNIGFLFNHDHVHQVAHGAPIAFEMSRRFPSIEVTLLTTSAEARAVLDTIAARFPGHRCRTIALDVSPVMALLGRVFDALAPVRKLAILRDNLAVFRRFDALVVAEKTSLLLRSRFGLSRLKMIHTRHGAGDRAIGFNDESREFDFVLLSGEKIRRRLAAGGNLRDGHFAVVGYPKFDAVGAFEPPRAKLFDNERPTVLYNPHCSPHLSSWFRMGRDILEFFHRSNEYNLIVAPHVMLFRRRFQISVDKFDAGWARGIPRRYRQCPHMLIDTGSAACTDMTYTLAADLYLGDVSSQICEFLVRPRPCLFVNAHHVAWQGDENYAAWALGPVLDDIDTLGAQLALAFSSHANFLPAQQRYFAETFDLSDESSSLRAGSAIAAFLDRECGAVDGQASG